jgi:hypothetical protein
MPNDKNKRAKSKNQQPMQQDATAIDWRSVAGERLAPPPPPPPPAPPAPPLYLGPIYGRPVPYPQPEPMSPYVDPLSAQVEDFLSQNSRYPPYVTPPELEDKLYRYYYPNKRGEQPFTAQDSSEVEGFLSRLLPKDQVKARTEAIRSIRIR